MPWASLGFILRNRRSHLATQTGTEWHQRLAREILTNSERWGFLSLGFINTPSLEELK